MKALFIFLMVFLVFIGCENSTGPPVDTTPPRVVSTIPEKGATDVPANCNQCTVKVEFSEEINPKTVNIIVEPIDRPTTSPVVPTGLTGTVVVDGKVALFKLNANLQYATTYQATVKAGVRDKAGNAMKQDYVWSFTTEKAPAVPDTIPPQVVSTEPADGATDVIPTVQIQVVFSEKVKVPHSAFSLKDENGASVSGSRSVSGSTFTFIPQNPLAFNTTYTATITTAVTDLAGNHLAQNYSFSFTVKPDDIAPQLVETHPADGDTGVAKDTDIWVKFDEPIDPASVNAATFAVSGSGGNVSGNYFVSNDTARFAPDSLDWETTYTVTLSGITDLAGNPMAAHTFSFTTQADTTPRWVVDGFWISRLAIDDNGYVYAVGYPYWIVKFSPDGKIIWKKMIAGINDTRDVAVYGNNVYVLGVNAGNMGGPGRVVKLDGDGNILWTSQEFAFMPRKIEIGEDGRVFVPDGALYEFDPNTGDIVHIQGVGNNYTGVYGIVAFTDYIYVSGETGQSLFGNLIGETDWFVIKYDANYSMVWGIQFNGPDSVGDFVGNVAVDKVSNYVYISGGSGYGMQWIKDGIAAYIDNGNSVSFAWYSRVTNYTSALPDYESRLISYNGDVYYSNNYSNTPVKIQSDGIVLWNLNSDGVSDFDFYNGKMYVLFKDNQNKIFLFNVDTGAPLN